jgi:hypothetical protein
MSSKFDTRVTLVEQAVVAQKIIDSRQDIDSSEFKKSIKEDLRDLSNKLDRLIERTVPVK